MTGVIKRLVTDRDTGQSKGFGFIHGDGDHVEYFFHRSGLDGTTRWEDLHEGDQVSFTVSAGEQGKGPRAIEIRVMSSKTRR